jgi:Tripartite tricarboxylate transporter TctB family
MITRAISSVDTWSGLLCGIFGALFIALSTDYDVGSAAAMGPAYFPIWLGSLLIALGALLVAKGQWGEAEPISPTALLPALIVLGAIAVFAVLLEHAGLFLSGLVLVYVGSLASASFGAGRLALFGVGLVLFVAFVFVYALGVPIPLWPQLGA